MHVYNLRMLHKQRYALSSNNLKDGLSNTKSINDDYPRIRFLSNNNHKKNKFVIFFLFVFVLL